MAETNQVQFFFCNASVNLFDFIACLHLELKNDLNKHDRTYINQRSLS